MLDRLEERLESYDDVAAYDVAAYAERLGGRVEATRFPSVDLMQRIDRLAKRLEGAERRCPTTA